MKIKITEQQYRKLVNESNLNTKQLGNIGMEDIKQLYALRTERLWDNIFGNKERIYIPYELSKEDVEAINDNIVDSESFNNVKDTIENYIKNKYGVKIEMTPDDYKNNLISFKVKSEYNNTSGTKIIKISIGKILNKIDPDLLIPFNNDKNRVAVNKNDLEICISREPLDVAAMSSNRGWTSCMDLDSGSKEYKCIPNEIANGTCVAYLIRKDDEEIDNPLAKVTIRSYFNLKNPKDVILLTSKKTYPSNFNNFRKIVHEYINDKMDYIDHDSEYQLAINSYPDDINFISGKGLVNKESFIKKLKNMKSISIQSFISLYASGNYVLLPKKINIYGFEKTNLKDILEHFPEESRLDFLFKLFELKKDLIDIITNRNIIKFLYLFPENDKFKLFKYLYSNNWDFRNSINFNNIIDLIGNFTNDDKTKICDILVKNGIKNNKIDEDGIYIILMYSKNPIGIFNKITEDKRVLIKNFGSSDIKNLQNKSINPESVKKILKHYNLI